MTIEQALEIMNATQGDVLASIARLVASGKVRATTALGARAELLALARGDGK